MALAARLNRRERVGALAALAAEVADLRQRVAALEAIPPRDAADRVLGDTIATSTQRHPFRSHELLEHAAVIPALAAALADVGIQSADELGAWLRDRVGTRAGITITRLSGRRWLVTLDAGDT